MMSGNLENGPKNCGEPFKAGLTASSPAAMGALTGVPLFAAMLGLAFLKKSATRSALL